MESWREAFGRMPSRGPPSKSGIVGVWVRSQKRWTEEVGKELNIWDALLSSMFGSCQMRKYRLDRIDIPSLQKVLQCVNLTFPNG